MTSGKIIDMADRFRDLVDNLIQLDVRFPSPSGHCAWHCDKYLRASSHYTDKQPQLLEIGVIKTRPEPSSTSTYKFISYDSPFAGGTRHVQLILEEVTSGLCSTGVA